MKKNIIRFLFLAFIVSLVFVGCKSTPPEEPQFEEPAIEEPVVEEPVVEEPVAVVEEPAEEDPEPEVAAEPAPVVERTYQSPSYASNSDGVNTIGEYAFAFNNLRSIVIPDSVTNIGRLAFYGNPIRDITIGANVELGETAFVNGFVVYYFNEFYESNGRQGGRYTYKSGRWSYESK